MEPFDLKGNPITPEEAHPGPPSVESPTETLQSVEPPPVAEPPVVEPPVFEPPIIDPLIP
jgi:hypothetical protein